MNVSFHMVPKKAQRTDLWNVLELEAGEKKEKGKESWLCRWEIWAGKGRR